MHAFLDKTKEFFGFKEEEFEALSISKPAPQEELKKSQPKQPFKGSLVNTQATRSFPVHEIRIEEPRIYEDSLNIATQLRENNPVIVNLKYLDPESSKRLVDFICGTAYAINGHMMKIGENIFLFTPANIFIANNSDKTTFEQGLEQQEKKLFFKNVSGL